MPSRSLHVPYYQLSVSLGAATTAELSRALRKSVVCHNVPKIFDPPASHPRVGLSW
jgi:hypothetical protein